MRSSALGLVLLWVTATGCSGPEFEGVASNSTADFMGVWGASADRVYAVSLGREVHHFNGSVWRLHSEVPTENGLFSISGSSDDDLWVCGENGYAARWDGTAWTQEDVGLDGTLFKVWAHSRDLVYVLRRIDSTERAPNVARWDGTRWETATVGRDRLGTFFGGLLSIHGTRPDSIWVTGFGGTIAHWDGTAWVERHPTTPENIHAVFALDDDTAWAFSGFGGAIRWDGSRWDAQDTGTTRQINSAWASGIGDVWAAGELGKIIHHDGTRWRSVFSGTAQNITGIWGSGPGDIWIVGESGMIRRRRN